jgi:hypothetical protein
LNYSFTHSFINEQLQYARHTEVYLGTENELNTEILILFHPVTNVYTSGAAARQSVYMSYIVLLVYNSGY